MPELPEVEVLVRHLRPVLLNKTIREVVVRRKRVVAPTSAVELRRTLQAARFTGLARRGKYLVFELRKRGQEPITLVGHLGMTGRMYLLRTGEPLPKHAAVVLNLGRTQFVYEDTRYFGRFTLDVTALTKLGPEPLGRNFDARVFARGLRRSRQSIKVKLLDQTLIAGVGNIYASEALFRAKIPPTLPSRKLSMVRAYRLSQAIASVLREAIRFGSTVPLNHTSQTGKDKLFYFGRAANTPDYYEERLRVYDRAGRPCPRCGASIRRIVQAARSTFYCPCCQR